jgi:transketolase C-terminal domain/subunit
VTGRWRRARSGRPPCSPPTTVEAIVDVPGPVYLRLKLGEIPVIFDDEHVLRLDRADVLVPGTDVA